MYDMLPPATVRLCGREVLRLGIGGARWSIDDPIEDGPAESILRHAINSGIQYIDTARAYTTRGSESHNELLIRRVLDQDERWDDVIVATKGGHFRDGDRYPVDASPTALTRDCERSLRALGRDSIDLYYLHYPDPQVPFEGSVRTLHGLRDAGLIGAIGLCNVTAEQLSAAVALTRVSAVQNRLSPYRPVDLELIELCRRLDIAYVGYSPLASGTGGAAPAELSAQATRAAAERRVAVETILLAWLLSLSPNVAVVTGARRPDTLASSVAATAVALTSDERDGIFDDLRTYWGGTQ